MPLLEAHLFDFDGDLYGKHLSVELIAYLRPGDAKFAGLAALIAQIGAGCRHGAGQSLDRALPAVRRRRAGRALKTCFC